MRGKTFKFTLPALFMALSISTLHLNAAPPRDLDFHYGKGVSLYEKEKYTAAANEFRKAAGYAGPDDGTQLMHIDYYIALCASELKADNAEETLEGFLRTYPNSIYTNDIRFALAGTLLEKKDFRGAYELFLAISPYELGRARLDEYNFKTGYAAYMIGDVDKAYTYFSNCTSDQRYLPHATYYTAYIDYTRGNLTAAKRGFQSIAGNQAYAPLVPFYLLQIEFSEQNYPYVVEHGAPLMAQATTARKAEIARIVSEAHFHLKDYGKALSYITEYEKLGGTMGPEERYMSGYCNYAAGNYAKAIEQLSTVAGTENELGQNASYHLGDAYLRTGDKMRALRAFAQASGGAYNRAIREDALFNYGKLQYELGGGAFNEAITILNSFVTEFPNSSRIGEAREFLLAAYFNSRNYEAAYEAIKLVKNPDNNLKTALQKITYFRALDYFEEGNYDKALEFFRISDANQFNPKYTALTKFWTAETYMRKGEYDAAVPLLRSYIQLSPATEREHKVALYDLGYCSFNGQKWSEADSWFSKFLTAYPTHDALRADALNRTGDIRMAQREYSKAIDQYDQAIQYGINPHADYARYHRAVMLGLANQGDKKVEALRAIIAAREGDFVDDAMFELGRTYVQRDRFSDGAAVLKRLVAEYPASPHYLSALSELGLTYQNLGNDNEALTYYKMVVEKFPNSPQSKDAMLGIRNIYVDRNDIDAYAAFARQSGVETNVDVVERDSLSFAAADRIYQAGTYAKALPLMKTYLQQYPRGAYRVDALYAVADCSLHAGDRPAALAAFLEAGAMPLSRYKGPALQQAAKIQMENKDYTAAAKTYKELASTTAQPQLAVEALTGYIRAMSAAGDPKMIETAAGEVLESPFTTPELAREATFAKAQALHAQKRDAEALPLYRKVAESMRTRDGSEAQYRIISILHEEGKDKEAEAAVFAFAEQNTSYQYWMGKSFLILGDIYTKQNDAFQAKATFQSIIDGYADKTDGVVAEAQEKIKNLK